VVKWQVPLIYIFLFFSCRIPFFSRALYWWNTSKWICWFLLLFFTLRLSLPVSCFCLFVKVQQFFVSIIVWWELWERKKRDILSFHKFASVSIFTLLQSESFCSLTWILNLSLILRIGSYVFKRCYFIKLASGLLLFLSFTI